MMKKQPPRERAARALCRLAGLPEDITHESQKMWQHYLLEADTVLEAALSPEEWERMKVEGPFDRN